MNTKSKINDIVNRWFKNSPHPLPEWMSEGFIKGVTDAQTHYLTLLVEKAVEARIKESWPCWVLVSKAVPDIRYSKFFDSYKDAKEKATLNRGLKVIKCFALSFSLTSSPSTHSVNSGQAKLRVNRRKCKHDYKGWGVDPTYINCRKCGNKLPNFTPSRRRGKG